MGGASSPRRCDDKVRRTCSRSAAGTSRPSTTAVSDEEIRVIDVRHEQTAGHAADGYARVTGRPGVCAVTAGPGVTDVVTAVANAQRAGVPIVVLGGAGPEVSLRHGLAAGHGCRHVDAPHHQVERSGRRT